MSSLHWINYNHLYYFWMVVRENGLGGASRKLRLTQSTISGQLRNLEQSLRISLFHRSGRRLQLTDVGQVVYRYASEMFSLGQELKDELSGRPTGRPIRAVIGVAPGVPELVARELIAPVLQLAEPIQISCRRERSATLIAELATHAVDVVIAAEKVTSAAPVFNHMLRHSDIVLVASPELARQYAPGFPRSLEGAPMLLPADTPLRRLLDEWFEACGVRPRIVMEFHDNALMETVGEGGFGIFPTHTVVLEEVCRRFNVQLVGNVAGAREEFFALTAQAHSRNRAVQAITKNAAASGNAGRDLLNLLEASPV
jgi:LysR family transcriptional activator of nhaA